MTQSVWYTLSIEGQAVALPYLVLLSVGVGLVAGTFGVGGGFLMVPLLHVVLGLPLPVCVGAALCQSIATSSGALLRYRNLGLAESRFDIMLLGGSLFGVLVGTRLLSALSDAGVVYVLGKSLPILQLGVVAGYSVIFVITAALLWFRPSAGGGNAPLTRLRIGPRCVLPVADVGFVSGVVVGYVGFVNGLLAGLLGIGGGICLIPIMLYGFGFDIRKTAGTGTVVVLAVAALGTLQHGRLGNVHLGLALPLIMGSGLAAQVGASLTAALPPKVLRHALAWVMIGTLVALYVKLFQ